MNRKTLRLKKRRHILFEEQKGVCYWEHQGKCFFEGEPMEMDSTIPGENGELVQNQRYASFEHLVPRREGGGFSLDNIVLAHAKCNNEREPDYQQPRDNETCERRLIYSDELGGFIHER